MGELFIYGLFIYGLFIYRLFIYRLFIYRLCGRASRGTLRRSLRRSGQCTSSSTCTPGGVAMLAGI